MAVAANADDYTNGRMNIFFPGVIPSLDGQCVSLVKWFMAEMSKVPNPQAARGDARYVGKTLVNQGHAVEVPWADRKRGDIVCYEYGTYGHIGVLLSGNRTFEENVNWSEVASKIVDGARVYASRIGSMAESWRHDMHIYRLNTYSEGEDMIQDSDNEFSRWRKLATQVRGRHQGFTRDEFRNSAVGRTWLQAIEILSDDPEADDYYSDSMLDVDNLTNLMGELGIPGAPNDNDKHFHINVLGGRWKRSFYDLIQRTDRIRIPDLQKTIVDLKAQIAAGGTGIDPATKAQITETNTTVKAISDKIGTVFK